MGTKNKTPDALDAMVEHVLYEVMQILRFVMLGNGWCDALNPQLRQLAQPSILEAGLLHFRCLIEFLGDQPGGDRVTARDYVKDWDWKIGAELGKVGELHGRLAHLGTIRRSVATDGAFSWESWLNGEAPNVLRGFRDFLERLRASSPNRYQLFIRPREGLAAVDLPAILNSMLGEGR